MYPVFESIAVVQGVYQNLEAHNRRVFRTAKALWQQNKSLHFLETCLPEPPKEGIFKCRFLYNANQHEVQFSLYKPRVINTLHCCEVTNLFYDFKYSYRDDIDKYTLPLKANHDVLFTRNGLLLDTSYANVALFRGGQWYTPETPLLQGTRRDAGLRTGELIPASIHINDIQLYEKITWFNAMIPINQYSLPISSIHFI